MLTDMKMKDYGNKKLETQCLQSIIEFQKSYNFKTFL